MRVKERSGCYLAPNLHLNLVVGNMGGVDFLLTFLEIFFLAGFKHLFMEKNGLFKSFFYLYALVTFLLGPLAPNILFLF